MSLGLDGGSAVLSADGLYRYVLCRAWGTGPLVTWVMLNPSTADADTDDPTIRKVMAFSRSWGMGSCAVVNLFAWRATDPRELLTAPDPVGPDNRVVIEDWVSRAHLVVAAWGNGVEGPDRRGVMPVELIAHRAGKPLHHLGLTNPGHPRHPGRIGYDTPLQEWTDLPEWPQR